jgi:hypothetical protein
MIESNHMKTSETEIGDHEMQKYYLDGKSKGLQLNPRSKINLLVSKSLNPSESQKGYQPSPVKMNQTSSHIKIHKDLFSIFESEEKHAPSHDRSKTSKLLMNKLELLNRKNSHLSQTNVDVFNMQLLLKTNIYSPAGGQNAGAFRMNRIRQKLDFRKKLKSPANLSQLKVIRSFANAQTFV